MTESHRWRLVLSRAMLANRLEHLRYLVEHRLAERRYVRHVTRSMGAGGDLFDGRRLPAGYGAGMSERAVEFGWVFAQGLRGRVLDAGSTLNHEYTLSAVLPRVASLDIFTLVPEETNFPERGVTYGYGDLRELPYEDATFDAVVSISVLEHVGMDNRGYGGADHREGDPTSDVARAVAEMRRVLRPGGSLLVTVPYGQARDHGWLRVFDAAAVDELRDAAGDPSAPVTVYAVKDGAWQISSLVEAADAAYGEGMATAVACVHARA